MLFEVSRYSLGLVLRNGEDVREAYIVSACTVHLAEISMVFRLTSTTRVGTSARSSGRVIDCALWFENGVAGIDLSGTDIRQVWATVWLRRTEDGVVFAKAAVCGAIARNTANASITRGNKDGSSLQTELQEPVQH